ncbi:MAG: OmpA family protein [Prevotellaceae bacterium]|jgi:outer membrane protein OmpA-like peptidoglycan-associated protein|nr:OmpA family protein [Prevotellaceae bacterium]
MKTMKITVLAVIAAMLMSGCASMSNTGKGAAIGGGGGAALGAAVGALFGKDAKSAAIGAAIGGVVGAGTGTIIGAKMDRQKKELEAIQGAQVEDTTDKHGLQAIKVTFEGGILFATGKSTITPAAQTRLIEFANSLIANPETDVAIYGHTDNTGSAAVNQKLSQERADAVASFIASQGVARTRMTTQGMSFNDPVADNSTEAGRAQNRRVEIYITANAKMIQQAEAQAK